jgi:protein translocase SecG subunit
MELLYNILSTLHIFACIMLVLFILFQKGTGDGLFTTNSSSNPFMSGVEVVGFLGKVTKFLGAFFLINTLVLASLSVKIANKNKVVVVEAVKEQKSSVPLGTK